MKLTRTSFDFLDITNEGNISYAVIVYPQSEGKPIYRVHKDGKYIFSCSFEYGHVNKTHALLAIKNSKT